MTKILAIALESVGIVMITVGITVETMTGAQLGHTIITSGAVIIAIGSLIFAKFFRSIFR